MASELILKDSPRAHESFQDMPKTNRKKRNVVGYRRCSDPMLQWVTRDYPQLAVWRELAVDWLKGEPNAVHVRLSALVVFLERYLIQQRVPLDPASFFSRNTLLPDFYQTACPDSGAGVAYNNLMHGFLNWALLRDFSERAEDGHPLISPAYRNPIARRSTSSGSPKLDESVHTPLPYGYIDELRKMLAAGPHFRDWKWAQKAAGPDIGKSGIVGPDWFPALEQDIDREDPDCV